MNILISTKTKKGVGITPLTREYDALCLKYNLHHTITEYENIEVDILSSDWLEKQ